MIRGYLRAAVVAVRLLAEKRALWTFVVSVAALGLSGLTPLPAHARDTVDTVVLVADLNPGYNDGEPSEFTEASGLLFFTAGSIPLGHGLWRTDGTSSGTAMVKEFSAEETDVGGLTQMGGLLYFTADDGTAGDELWRSDGTAAGTWMVKDIASGRVGSHASDLVVVDGVLYFAATDLVHGRELWRSDGTTDGTSLVRDIHVSFSSDPINLTEFGGDLFFSADDGVSDVELWRSDGSAAGTALVKDININPSSGSSYPSLLIESGGRLFFRADDGVHGDELWRTDGTPGGTVLVEDILAGRPGALPVQLTDFDGTLFFSANDGAAGWELWSSDGSAAGTSLVKDVRPGVAWSDIYISDANLPGWLLFTANDGTHGRELWRSDGTTVGTAMVKDIRSGPESSSDPQGHSYGDEFLAADGQVFFSASDGGTGEELWQTDGTAFGTLMVEDIDAGPYASHPAAMTELAGNLLFAATTQATGRELWRLVRNPTDMTPPDTVILAGPENGAVITVDQATFSFEGTPGDTSRLQCSLDEDPFHDCISPHTFTGLANGSHVVALRAVDAVGNADPTPARRTFTITSPPPTTPPEPPEPPEPPPTPPPPTIPVSNRFTVAKSGEADTSEGTVSLFATVPGAGTLELGPARRSPVRYVSRAVAPGPHILTVKLTRAGKVQLAKRLQQAIRQGRKVGKLKVQVDITFIPRGGTERTKSRVYTVKLR